MQNQDVGDVDDLKSSEMWGEMMRESHCFLFTFSILKMMMMICGFYVSCC